MPNLLIGRNRALLRRTVAQSGGGFSVQWNGVVKEAELVAATATITDIPIGPAQADRKIVYAIGCSLSGSGVIATLTAADASAAALTPARRIQQIAASTRCVEMGIIPVPTGETMSITMGASVGNFVRYGLTCWIVNGSDEATEHARSGTIPNANSSTANINLGAVDVPDGAILMGVGYMTASDPFTVTQSPGAAPDKRWDGIPGTAGTRLVFFESDVVGSAQIVNLANSAAAATNMRGAAMVYKE